MMRLMKLPRHLSNQLQFILVLYGKEQFSQKSLHAVWLDIGIKNLLYFSKQIPRLAIAVFVKKFCF